MTDDIDSVLSSSDTIPDDVTTDVPPENEQDDATQVSDEFQKLELQEAKNALRYRRWFMWWGLGAVSFCIIVSAITVGSLFWFGGYREMASVLIAFIGSIAVEVVGIAIVIAKYLFPNGGPTHPGQDNSNQQLAK